MSTSKHPEYPFFLRALHFPEVIEFVRAQEEQPRRTNVRDTSLEELGEFYEPKASTRSGPNDKDKFRKYYILHLVPTAPERLITSVPAPDGEEKRRKSIELSELSEEECATHLERLITFG